MSAGVKNGSSNVSRAVSPSSWNVRLTPCSGCATHPRLPDLPDARVQSELVESRRTLQGELHRPVEALAYPFNSVRARIEKAARAAGYRVAVAGVEHGSADLLSLRRMPVNGMTRMEQFTAELAVFQR